MARRRIAATEYPRATGLGATELGYDAHGNTTALADQTLG